MRYLLISSLALLLTSCSYSRKFAQVGPYEFHKFQLGSIVAPSQTFVGIYNTNTQVMDLTTPIGGNGILSAAVLGAAGVGSSLAIADGLDRTGWHTSENHTSISDKIEVNNNVQTAVDVRVTDDPPSPPVTRPPKNRPPPHKWK